MEILLNEHKLGCEIVKAFSFIPGYSIKVITKTECFKEGLGILLQKVNIELTSLTKMKKTNKECRLFIVIDNLELSKKYIKISMAIRYLYNNGSLSYVPLLISNQKADLKTEIETMLYQIVWSLKEITLEISK